MMDPCASNVSGGCIRAHAPAHAAAEARDAWAALVAGAETTIITRYGKPVAVVGPIDPPPMRTP